MAREPLAALPLRPCLGDVLDLLHSGSHDYMPVVQEGGGSGSSEGVGKGADDKGEGWQAGGGRTLAGVLYRWQLVGLLRHPALLHLLAANDDSVPGAACAAAASGSEAAAAVAAAGAATGAAGAAKEAAPAASAPGGEAHAPDHSAAVLVPAPLVERLTRQQRLVLLALLAGSPEEELLQGEADVLAMYEGSGSRCGAEDGDTKAALPVAASGADEQPEQQEQPEQVQQAQQQPLPLSQRLDLTPLLQCHPVTAQPSIPVSHAQLVLRHLGLLGLAIHSEPVRLADVVTREDVRRVAEAD